MACDLRFVVSVLRVLGELERIGDLALRVVKLAPDWELLRSGRATYDILLSMADTAVEQYRTALRAWSAQDLGWPTSWLASVRPMDATTDQLHARAPRLEGPDAVLCAVRTLVAGRSLDRIADHAVDHRRPPPLPAHRRPGHLATEIR